jgi:hypothetical protein
VPSQALCGTTQGQFPNFQILFVKQRFGSPGKVVHLAGHAKLPSLLRELAPEFWREERRREVSRRKIEECMRGPKFATS